MGEKSTTAIEAINVSRVFGSGEDRVIALDNVSVKIRENEFFTLLGPSGCGKTTLLRLIAGFDHPTNGQLLLDGEDISRLPPYKRPINTVFQNYALFPHLTVARNIAFGLENLGKTKSEVIASVDKMLALVKMEAMRNRLVSQLSGGQQQRVALARALAPHPKVLLLDEPLSALDLKLRKEMQIELKRLQHETGITFIFVTHDQEEALTMSDNIAVINNGTIRQLGTPSEIYDAPAERFVADFIGDTNILSGKVISSGNHRVLIDLSCGSKITAKSENALRDSEEVFLAVRPEHASLAAWGESSDISGQLENIIYFGTDTHYHVRLGNNDRFTVRVQNKPDEKRLFNIGDKIGIKLAGNAVRVLQG